MDHRKIEKGSPVMGGVVVVNLSTLETLLHPQAFPEECEFIAAKTMKDSCGTSKVNRFAVAQAFVH